MVTAADVIRASRKEAASKGITGGSAFISILNKTATAAVPTRKVSSSSSGSGSTTSNNVSPTISFVQPKPVTSTQTSGTNNTNILNDINVNHTTSGDEIDVFVSITNKSNVTEEFRAFLYSATGQLMSKEPDFFFKNIKAGTADQISFSSRKNPFWDINSLNGGFRVEVRTQGGRFVGVQTVTLNQQKDFFSAPTTRIGGVVDSTISTIGSAAQQTASLATGVISTTGKKSIAGTITEITDSLKEPLLYAVLGYIAIQIAKK